MKPETKLLRRIAAIPAGEKLPMSRFARELNCTLSVVIDMVQAMVRDGLVDAVTVRPPQSEAAPDASGLLADIEAFLVRTGMSATAFGDAATGAKSLVARMRAGHGVRAASVTKIRAFMASPSAAPTPGASEPPGEPEGGSLAPPSGLPTDERPTGEQLYLELQVAAQVAKVGLKRFAQPLWKQDSGWKLEQLRIAKHPQRATVARVRALIAGQPLPPTHNTPAIERGEAGARLYELDAVERERAKVAHLRDVNETRHEARARRLREVTEREAAERVARRREAGRLPTAHPLDLSDVVGDALIDSIDTASDRRARDFDEIASPSSLLRRAQRDWPDQCAKVKALAEELGVTLAEAWHRVIGAGVDCMTDAEAI